VAHTPRRRAFQRLARQPRLARDAGEAVQVLHVLAPQDVHEAFGIRDLDEAVLAVHHGQGRDAVVQGHRGHALVRGAGGDFGRIAPRGLPDRGVVADVQQLRGRERAEQATIFVEHAHQVPVGAMRAAQPRAHGRRRVARGRDERVRPAIAIHGADLRRMRGRHVARDQTRPAAAA
jgi:hypothetical protein